MLYFSENVQLKDIFGFNYEVAISSTLITHY